ncbi:hypothetical protein [Chitinophaga deserti]|uniref:hypothetical protein n=1 Tax=Chitinophaga deserti TaxID=2164099 RepID=UPI000D6B0026|nr:hypothetical protein [Chitinophaga deserti]
MTEKKNAKIKPVTKAMFIGAAEMERLRKDVDRSDEEKFLSLLWNIKLSNTLKKMKVTHK